jgi:hypothetical protein
MYSIEAEISWEDLEQQVRAVYLEHQMGQPFVHPYAEADISLKTFHTEEVRPTSLYVVESKLRRQGRIAHELGLHGRHPLALPGGLRVASDRGERFGVIPPIVETTSADGSYILYGLHQICAGVSETRRKFRAIHIQNANPNYPSYSLPNDWEDIEHYDDKPLDPTLKRRYRELGSQSLRRDFGPLTGSSRR